MPADRVARLDGVVVRKYRDVIPAVTDQCEGWGEYHRCNRTAKHKGVKSGKALCGPHAGGERRSKSSDEYHHRLWQERQAREAASMLVRTTRCLHCDRLWTKEDGNPDG